MKKVKAWLESNSADLVKNLAELVAIQSISPDGDHEKELEQSAEATCQQMRAAGLQNVETLTCDGSLPYAYGEWLGAAGAPTVFLYAHHDVQPVNEPEQWLSPPFELTERDGRLYGRGSADDKAAIVVQLGAIAAYLKSTGSLPVNVKMLVEGEEEVGSRNLAGFFEKYKDKIRADAIVVCDTGNLEVGQPCITYSLRGNVAVLVEVEAATKANHSGTAGGALADPALALNVILARLFPKKGKFPIPGFYDKVAKMSSRERSATKKMPGGDEDYWRNATGALPGVEFVNQKNVSLHEQTWRYPAITIIAQEASSIRSASNQVLPKARAIVSCRIVPDQEPGEVCRQICDFLKQDAPWGVKVKAEQHGSSIGWWMTDPKGPAFDAAMKALKSGFGAKPMAIGCGGSIGFVGPLAELFGGAPALMLGIEDPLSSPHAANESMHAGDLQKLTVALAHLFENLGKLPADGLKFDPSAVKAPKPRAQKPPAPAAEESPSQETPAEGNDNGAAREHADKPVESSSHHGGDGPS